MARDDHGAAFRRRLFDDVARHILEAGQSVVGVFDPDGEDLPFSYTIGNTAHGLPELLIVGLEPRAAQNVLNALGLMMRERGTAFANLEQVSLHAGALPVLMVETDDRGTGAFAVQAAAYYADRPVAVVQVLVPDPLGLFPGHAGCQQPYASVEVLNEDYPRLLAALLPGAGPVRH
jgi:hypothetical protein